MRSKIERSLLEGRLLIRARRSLTSPILHRMLLFEERLDFFIGRMVRIRYSKKQPINPNLIVFCSFQGDFTDNPKYILKELISRKEKMEIVWIGREKSAKHPELFPKEVSHVYEWNTKEAFQALMQCRILIINSVELFKKPWYIKEGQVVIQTWHGSLGIKRFDKNSNKSKNWVKAAMLSSKHTDYLISNSDFENNIYRTSYWEKSEILMYGHPRNDILFETDKTKIINLRKKIFSKYKITEKGQKIVLYAPTFRDSKTFDCYSIDIKTTIKCLETRFKGKWICLVRYHPTIRSLDFGQKLGKTENVFDVTNYPDIQELLAISDVGISDYSSWMFDFLLTGRPVFIFATDIGQYNTERGFAYPLESTPFPIATNNKELQNNIIEFNAEDYFDSKCKFLEHKGAIEDGRASKRVSMKIKQILDSNDGNETIFNHNLKIADKYENGEAYLFIARALRDGKGVDKDEERALRYYKKAASVNIKKAKKEMFDLLLKIGSDDALSEAIKIKKEQIDKHRGYNKFVITYSNIKLSIHF